MIPFYTIVQSANRTILETIYQKFEFENGILLQDSFIQGEGFVHEGDREHQNLHY